MRDIVLVLAFVAAVPLTFRAPFAGVLVWAWIALMSPHRIVYGFASGQPFNMVIAVVTILAWLISKERKQFPSDGVPWLMVIFAAWMTFNSFFAPNPDQSWPLWDLTIKSFVFALMVAATLTGKARIHAMIWVIVLSIGFYGVKGGAFTLLTGGHYRVYGPESTIIADNNQLAVAVTMILPLVIYLFQQTEVRWLRLALAGSVVLQIINVLGSYSRGGFVALFSMLFFFWLRSQRKAVYLILGLAVVLPALWMMPDTFWDRMATIQDASEDASFQGRTTSWLVCLYYALDHFPLGAGFAGTQVPSVFNVYFPDLARAAHSIYFQVLGEHGFVGLALYLAMLALAWSNCAAVIRQTRNSQELAWACELARMLQVGLVAFCVGGAGLSMAYYEGFLLLLIIPSALRQVTRRPAVRRLRTAPVGTVRDGSAIRERPEAVQ